MICLFRSLKIFVQFARAPPENRNHRNVMYSSEITKPRLLWHLKINIFLTRIFSSKNAIFFLYDRRRNSLYSTKQNEKFRTMTKKGKQTSCFEFHVNRTTKNRNRKENVNNFVFLYHLMCIDLKKKFKRIIA